MKAVERLDYTFVGGPILEENYIQMTVWIYLNYFDIMYEWKSLFILTTKVYSIWQK